MIDTTTKFGARAAQRLADEVVGWLTTVGPHGGPVPSPVWFVYEGEPGRERIVVYSYNTAKRNEHIATNPRVSLNLNSTFDGGDVVVVTGNARIAPDLPGPMEHDAYRRKYERMIPETEGVETAERFVRDYSVKIEITGLKLRGW